jgi:hypothetical protein
MRVRAHEEDGIRSSSPAPNRLSNPWSEAARAPKSASELSSLSPDEDVDGAASRPELPEIAFVGNGCNARSTT